ncbi:LysR family transcriptional regulator [Rhizobium sp. P40RR-XXII]|nr:LysR family transcriptional regulator [Rhizobium sp. P28RR-XV]NLS20704.1 LysR family transcriptional regulator [Rhizobium sp. P40RR-XXII]
MHADLLDGILAFTRVAERRSFTAAAKELGITTAGISWTIKQLEARVGTPLFTRTTRAVGLTEAGMLFLEHARVSVEQVDAAFEAAQTTGSRPTGLLRLNLPFVAQPLLEPILAEFAETYPEIELELTVEDRFVDIVAERYDAGIRIGEMIQQDMVAVRLTPPVALTVVGAPSYFARRNKPQRPEDLTGHACINIRQTSGGLYRWSFMEPGRNKKPRVFEIAVKGPLTVNGALLCVSAAASGVGLTYTVASVVEPLVRQGLLEPCLERFMPTIPGFFMYFPKQATLLPKLRAFLDFWAAKQQSANSEVIRPLIPK